MSSDPNAPTKPTVGGPRPPASTAPSPSERIHFARRSGEKGLGNEHEVLPIQLAALAICAVGIGKKTVTRWVLIPVMVFCVLVAIIAGLILIL